MIRTHKIALNPSPRQFPMLEQCATSAREAYNGALAYFKETLVAGAVPRQHASPHVAGLPSAAVSAFG